MPILVKKRRLVLYSIFFLFHLITIRAQAQEIGYVTGLSRLGLNKPVFQPVYGFSVGYQFNSHFGLETNLIYSQRSIGSTPQADYLSFIAMPKIGFFGKKMAVYYAPAFLLNPTLHHSQIENHTYVSTLQALGFQIKIGKKLILDAKSGYDFGLSGAYFSDNTYKTYSGVQVLLGLKLDLTCAKD